MRANRVESGLLRWLSVGWCLFQICTAQDIVDGGQPDLAPQITDEPKIAGIPPTFYPLREVDLFQDVPKGYALPRHLLPELHLQLNISSGNHITPFSCI